MMQFEPLRLAGAYRISLEAHTDERGFFARRFCAVEFAERGLQPDFVQRSISFNTRRGTLRGLHFQAAPHGEIKLVRCTRGAAFDVIVDIRQDSSTYGQWHAERLTAENRLILYIPEGFAHGFQTLEGNTELDYEIFPKYVPEATRGIRWDDPDIAISWPIAEITLGDRDRQLPLLSRLPKLGTIPELPA
jgi:dTDP-4-dehydrorhamnose 3,5-epimerase